MPTGRVLMLRRREGDASVGGTTVLDAVSVTAARASRRGARAERLRQVDAAARGGGPQSVDARHASVDGVRRHRRRAHRRGIGLMFQAPTLFPHRDVAGNVGVRAAHAPRPAGRGRAPGRRAARARRAAGRGDRSVTRCRGRAAAGRARPRARAAAAPAPARRAVRRAGRRAALAARRGRRPPAAPPRPHRRRGHPRPRGGLRAGRPGAW